MDLRKERDLKKKMRVLDSIPKSKEQCSKKPDLTNSEPRVVTGVKVSGNSSESGAPDLTNPEPSDVTGVKVSGDSSKRSRLDELIHPLRQNSRKRHVTGTRVSGNIPKRTTYHLPVSISLPFHVEFYNFKLFPRWK